MSLQTRIWITGAEGRLGSALVKHFEHNTDYEILTSDKDVPVEDDKQIIRFANLNHPDVIINCAAISDVDYCEKNPDEAYKINAIGARNVAVAARMINAKLIHISTDDVFNGVNEEAHNEFDTPKPISVYGKSKLAGESLVERLTDKHVIVRSSWLYGKNYDLVEQAILKAKKGEDIVIPKQEYSTPTSTRSLVDFLTTLITSHEYGLFHASDRGSCSRKEFFETVIKKANLHAQVKVARDQESRPAYSALDNMMLRITGIYKMPEWEYDLYAYLDRLRERGVL